MVDSRTALIVGMPRIKDKANETDRAWKALAGVSQYWRAAYIVYGAPGSILAHYAKSKPIDVVVCVMPKWLRACKAVATVLGKPLLVTDSDGVYHERV